MAHLRRTSFVLIGRYSILLIQKKKRRTKLVDLVFGQVGEVIEDISKVCGQRRAEWLPCKSAVKLWAGSART